jgi:hypothetical protein
VKYFLVAFLTCLAAACTADSDSGRGVAESFLDEHYVRMDLKAALEHVTGLAQHKVEDELRLVGDQEIDAGTMRPSVTYRLEETRRDGDERTNFLYRGKVTLDGGDSFEMRWLISVRREGGGWKVSNYQELQ